MKLITLGPSGTYSETAARKYRPSGQIILKGSLEEVLASLDKSCLAVVPAVNSSSGPVYEVLDLFRNEGHCVIDVFDLHITHALAGYGTLETAETVYAHPHAYLQCVKTLYALKPSIKVVYTKSNGETLQLLEKKKDPKILGIVPTLSAKTKEIPLLTTSLEDSPENTTRFIVIKKI